jgi:hypothetical protein
MQPELPGSMKQFDRELETLYRALPDLLATGHEGRHVLIHEDVVVGVWDTSDEALRVGYEKFDSGRFIAPRIRRDNVEGLEPYFRWRRMAPGA